MSGLDDTAAATELPPPAHVVIPMVGLFWRAPAPVGVLAACADVSHSDGAGSGAADRTYERLFDLNPPPRCCCRESCELRLPPSPSERDDMRWRWQFGRCGDVIKTGH